MPALPVSVRVPLPKAAVRVPGVATVRVSPLRKPAPMVTVALVSTPPLSGSVTTRPASSATGALPLS